MRKVSTIILSVLLVLVFACSFAACKDQNQDENSSSENTSELTVTIEKNIDEAGSVGKYETGVENGKQITLIAETNKGYTFVGWYNGETLVSTDPVYIVSSTAQNQTYTANYASCTLHTTDATGLCTNCKTSVAQASSATGITVSGNTVTFGSYPQTKVTDETVIAALTTSAGTLPTADDAGNWTSYGYYNDKKVSNYMWYIDKEYNGSKYRGVYFTSYRPYWCIENGLTGLSWQDDNGYNASTVYWFKYEPISWKVVNKENGVALLLANSAIDCQQYDYDGTAGNNYAESTIRKWLTTTFFNTAFNATEQASVLTAAVDNSAVSTGDSENKNACAETQDRVFLFGYKEKLQYCNGEDPIKSSNYADAQGAKKNGDNSWWWLRSPYSGASTYSKYINLYGGFDYCATYVIGGIRPALYVKAAE